jgi:hypothetical protein
VIKSILKFVCVVCMRVCKRLGWGVKESRYSRVRVSWGFRMV